MSLSHLGWEATNGGSETWPVAEGRSRPHDDRHWSNGAVAMGRKGGIAPDDRVIAGWNAAALDAAFKRRGVSSDQLQKLMDPAIGWDPGARILTDQYSPSNLLNAQSRRN